MYALRSIPRRMIIELVYWNIFWINIFPEDAGISKSIRPWTIITGLELDFRNHFKVYFGEYTHTLEQYYNSMEYRTIGALVLSPARNE